MLVRGIGVPAMLGVAYGVRLTYDDLNGVEMSTLTQLGTVRQNSATIKDITVGEEATEVTMTVDLTVLIPNDALEMESDVPDAQPEDNFALPI